MPLNARVQRILPFGLPVLLAVATFCTLLNRGDDEVAQAAASHQKGSGARNTPGTLKNADAPGRDAFDAIPVRIQPVPPSNQQVIDLLANFRQSDGRFSEAEVRALATRPLAKQVVVRGAGMELAGTVDSRLESDETVHIGIQLDDGLGRFQLSLREDDTVKASLMFTGESHAFAFNGLPKDGHWQMEATTVDHILCAPLGSTYPVARGQMAMPMVNSPKQSGQGNNGGPLGAPPILSSNPDSPFVIYCDFDGEVVTHPLWNDGNTINAAPHARADDVAFVTRVWERVSEDFAPFNINVTTDRTIYDSTAESRRVICVITPTNLAAPGAGGVAYVGSFGFGIPCWAFNDTEAACAETISHEVGHTLGLRHDGVSGGFAYYGGHGVGPTSWAPIMGAYFADFDPPFVDEEVTQFSIGEYPNADNQEDDLAIITGSNGFTYRQDDKGDSESEAVPLSISNGAISDSGIIEKRADKDYYAFATSGGRVRIDVSTTNINSPDDPQKGSNLAVSAEILGSNGKRVLIADPQDSLDASISTILSKGNYYLVVDGAGRGNLTNGFSDYASIGQYSISGTVPQEGILTVNPPTLELPREGGDGTFQVSAEGSWTWSSDEDWLVTKEATSQSGSQVFDYTIPRNLSRNARTATIRITDGTFTAVHAVTQNGSSGDDHGDQMEDATLVGQSSITRGNLEVEGDIDVFRVEVQGFGNLKVRSTGGTDTYGEFLDAYGNRLAANDDKRKPNFEFSHPVGTGIYYISVRHAHEGGSGLYKLVCSFEKGSILAINPVKRVVGPDGGKFLLQVSSNVDWEWSASASWVQSALEKSQSAGQLMAYEVTPNNSSKDRTSYVTLTYLDSEQKTQRVKHTIVQRGSRSDDYANTMDRAGGLAQNGSVSGSIEFGGDQDLFKMVLQTSGELRVASTGTMDAFGELLDSKGAVVDAQDGGLGENFMISRAVGAGTYYVRVRHFSASELGRYGLVSNFTPSTLVDVKYSATSGGNIIGRKSQKIRLATDARPVTAVPDSGYSFHSWSDGLKDPSRTDRGVNTHLDLTARFVRTLSVKDANGTWVQDNQSPPVDFGTTYSGKARKMEFKITNNGSQTLKNLRIAKSGQQADAWSSSKLEVRDLKPGKSTLLTVTLKSTVSGYKSANFSIAASGAAKPFRLKVMGFVAESGTSVASSKKLVPTDSIALANVVPADKSLSVLAGSPASSGGPSESAWIAVSGDGLLHYHYHVAKGEKQDPELWISSNGETWSEASVVSVLKVSSGPKTTEYVALIEPLKTGGLVWVISEKLPEQEKK